MILVDVHAERARAEESEYLSVIAKEKMTSRGNTPDHIRVKNRRKKYLELHPEYFGPQLELADPLLYDRLIRRFQSKSERETEGRAKGYSGILEADLWRGEAKLNALKNPDPSSDTSYRRGKDGEILAEEKDEIPLTKEDGLGRWKDVMEQRFLRGGDQDFDYLAIDRDEKYDDVRQEEREHEEQYFDTETPEWVDDKGERGGPERELKGETGVQDF